MASRIDVHHHFYAPEYMAAAPELNHLPPVKAWSLAKTMEELDKNGVGTAMLSLSPPGIHHGPVDANRKLARAINEHAAKLRQQYPTRFGHFASLPLPDVEGSLAEIAYAMDTLKADGVQLMTSYGDKWPGNPAFDAVFDELNRRKAVVFIHPLSPACCGHLIDCVPPVLTEFTFDTTRFVFSLLFTGTLARCPDIKFIFCHAGGTIPMLAGRAVTVGLHRQYAKQVPNGIDAELKKLHYDVALAGNKPALAALFTYVPVSQVLLGSDYPFGTSTDGIAALESYGLGKGDLEAIYRGNAARLLPRLAAVHA
jgi:predicted TIM-barrel fold metal-dependent hydrolase